MDLRQSLQDLRQYRRRGGRTQRPRKPRRPFPKNRALPGVECLEDRTLPSITLFGVPNWVPQGPGPIIDSSGSTVCGAISAIAPDPTNANNLYVGTVNGGIWHTTNATALSPNWV